MSDWNNSMANSNQPANDSYEAQLAKMMADNREESRRQEEAHQARLEEDRRRQQQELETIKEEQRQREAERMKRMQEDRLRRIEAEKEQEKRMAAETHARIGLLQSMKNFVDSRLGRTQTVQVEEIAEYPQLMAPTGAPIRTLPPQYQQGPGAQGGYPTYQQQNPAHGSQPPYSRSQGNFGAQAGNNGF